MVESSIKTNQVGNVDGEVVDAETASPGYRKVIQVGSKEPTFSIALMHFSAVVIYDAALEGNANQLSRAGGEK